MANNKTSLQEAIQEMTFQMRHGSIPTDGYEGIVLKAAQAYADLPSKIKGMKMNLPDVFKDSGIIKECYEMRETTLDDILKLLEETNEQ